MKCFLHSRRLYQAVSEGLIFWSAFHILAWVLSVCSKLQPKGGQSPLFSCVFSNQDFKTSLCFLAASNPNRILKPRDLKSSSLILNTQNEDKILGCAQPKWQKHYVEKNHQENASKLKAEGKEVRGDLLNSYHRQKSRCYRPPEWLSHTLQDSWQSQVSHAEQTFGLSAWFIRTSFVSTTFWKSPYWIFNCSHFL